MIFGGLCGDRVIQGGGELMQFVTIDPRSATIEVVEAEQLTDVYERVGLKMREVDHGCLHRYEENGETINIVVYEFGLFKPVAEAKYFSLGTHLYEGGAVIYAADAAGDTVSIKVKPPVTFFRDASEVERAIASGDVERPMMFVNGQELWRWPGRRPNL